MIIHAGRDATVLLNKIRNDKKYFGHTRWGQRGVGIAGGNELIHD